MWEVWYHRNMARAFKAVSYTHLVELYEVVAAIYCKLIEASAQIKGLETVEKTQTTSRMRTSLASASGRKSDRNRKDGPSGQDDKRND